MNREHRIIEALPSSYGSTRVVYECGHSTVLPGKYTTSDTHECHSGCVTELWSKMADGTWEFLPEMRARFAPIECGCYAFVRCTCGIMGIAAPHAEHAKCCPVSTLPEPYPVL